MKKTRGILPLIAAGSIIFGGQALAQLSVYISPTGEDDAEGSGILGITSVQVFTENFNTIPEGPLESFTSSLNGASYSGEATITPNGIYGAYNQGNYVGVGQYQRLDVTFEASQYFGLSFTAIDPFNNIRIYSGNDLLLDLPAATLLYHVPDSQGATIAAIDGSQYNTQTYYGQPVTGENMGEIYTYLHFIASNSTTFDRVVFSQTGPGGSFESDNHSILKTAPTIPDSLAFVTSVPEPSTPLLAGLALATAALLRKRRV